jgi:hypothetical protein
MSVDNQTVISDKGLSTILDQVRDLALPLSLGKFVDDWASRSAVIGSLADTYYFYCRENGHWSNDVFTAGLHPLSLAPTRAALMNAPSRYPYLSLNFDYAELAGTELEIVQAAAARLDAAEKIVISTTAWSLCNLDNSPELTLDLMNLLFEEALHLEAISRFLGIDQADRDWIPEDRQGNWDLVKSCATSLEYMVIEHCLYEGRGTIASAAGVYELERAGAPEAVVAVMEAVAKQECAHNITGYRWLKLLDTGNAEHELSLADAVRRFVAEELLPTADGSSRSLKKHFPLYLLQKYRESHDFFRIKKEIVAASQSSRRSGEIGVRPPELYAASAQVLAWCEGS